MKQISILMLIILLVPTISFCGVSNNKINTVIKNTVDTAQIMAMARTRGHIESEKIEEYLIRKGYITKDAHGWVHYNNKSILWSDPSLYAIQAWDLGIIIFDKGSVKVRSIDKTVYEKGKESCKVYVTLEANPTKNDLLLEINSELKSYVNYVMLWIDSNSAPHIVGVNIPNMAYNKKAMIKYCFYMTLMKGREDSWIIQRIDSE